jgi:hypothetical protein
MPFTWRARRQLIYFSIILGAVIIASLFFIIPILTVKPTCFDNEKNGDEVGVDCGGACPRFCTGQLSVPTVLWARSFPVTENVYNALAYIENPNPKAGIPKISYVFKLYDDRNVFITQRPGQTFIDPNGRTTIFEPAIDVGNRVPKRTTLEFTQAPNWYRIESKVAEVVVEVRDQNLEATDKGARLTANAFNESIYDVPDLDIVVILYDKDNNAIATSKTYLESLPKNSSRQIFFTWPRPLEKEVFRVEILPKINSFLIKI